MHGSGIFYQKRKKNLTIDVPIDVKLVVVIFHEVGIGRGIMLMTNHRQALYMENRSATR